MDTNSKKQSDILESYILHAKVLILVNSCEINTFIVRAKL